MDRRTFMKLLGGLASMPIVGRIAKPLKSETVQEGIASVSEGGMKLYEMVVSKVIKEGKKIGESGRVDSYKHPDRPDITVDVNQTDGSAEIYFDTDQGSKGYAKIDRDMETGGTDLQEAEEVFTMQGDKDIEEGIRGGIENLEEFTRIKKAGGGRISFRVGGASGREYGDTTKASQSVKTSTNRPDRDDPNPMLVAELTPKQKQFIDSQKGALNLGSQTPRDVFKKITNPKLGIFSTPFLGLGGQEPTTEDEFNEYLKSIGVTQQVKDGGIIDLTVAIMPGNNKSGVESLFKTR